MFRMNKSKTVALSGAMLMLSMATAHGQGLWTKDGLPKWQGMYVGGTIGGTSSSGIVSFADGIAEESDVQFFNHTKNRRFTTKDETSEAFAGGAHAGYNFQKGNIVFGVEGDFTFTNSEQSVVRQHRFRRQRRLGTENEINENRVVGQRDAKLGLDYIASLKGRLGYAQGNFLAYVTGGVAFAGLSNEFTETLGPSGVAFIRPDGTTLGPEATPAGLDDAISPDKNRPITAIRTAGDGIDDSYIGYVIGAGGEYKWSESMSLRGDVLYYGFEDFDVTAVRIGASYHFN